ncbi:hypothetical protein OBBRIDRAFT_889137 [Obba rivulosa]|uniref:Uncharacterized protein n=1 Tax=Obba rivulosa TaxID=1052685 RepID=A0A8E2AP95_9APHY|nr:hypothetical protein OBBRIDRAFT_889137 [Obba rivulosa]
MGGSTTTRAILPQCRRAHPRYLVSTVFQLFAPSSPPSSTSPVTGPTLPILHTVSHRPPSNASFAHNVALTRHLLGNALSERLGLPQVSLYTYLRMRAALLVQAAFPWFGQLYPRAGWAAKRRALLREGIPRSLRWQLGMRRVSFRPRTEAAHGAKTSEGETHGEVADEGAELAPGVKEAECVSPDPARAKVLVRAWREVLVEMFTLSLAPFSPSWVIEINAQPLLGSFALGVVTELLVYLSRNLRMPFDKQLEYGIRAAGKGWPELLTYMKKLSKEDLVKVNKRMYEMRIEELPESIRPSSSQSYMKAMETPAIDVIPEIMVESIALEPLPPIMRWGYAIKASELMDIAVESGYDGPTFRDSGGSIGGRLAALACIPDTIDDDIDLSLVHCEGDLTLLICICTNRDLRKGARRISKKLKEFLKRTEDPKWYINEGV